MRRQLVCVFLSLIFATSLALTSKDAVAVVAGLVDGVIQQDDLSEIQECLTDVDTITKEIIIAI